jgi:hypothetical protein
MQGMIDIKQIEKDPESFKALMEYAIYISDKGDYVLQALTLKDLNPNGW